MTSEVDLLHAILRTLEHIEDMLRNANEASASSVQVATSTRGQDITTKAYAGSPIREAGDMALEEWLRVRAELERRLMDGFQAESEAQSSAYWKTIKKA